jgi:hypothetical protein
MIEMFWVGLKVYFWAAFLFLVPGCLFLAFLRSVLDGRAKRIVDGGSVLVGSFLLSILFNGCVLTVFTLAAGGLLAATNFLLIFDLGALALIVLQARRGFQANRFTFNFSKREIALVTFLVVEFFVLAYQGGLLDMLADGWWHLAYANQMIIEDSVLISQHPIAGGPVSSVLYPPLWHMQLALISALGGLELPVIWHFIAAFNVTMLSVAFYLFSKEISGDKVIATIAVILHAFVIGGLISYSRVAPWPGNVSYIFLYFAFYLTFRLTRSSSLTTRVENVTALGHERLGLLLMLGAALLAMAGLHGIEVILYTLAITTYWLVINVLPGKRVFATDFADESKIIGRLSLTIMFAGVVFVLVFLRAHFTFLFTSPRAYPPYINFIVPIGTVLYFGSYGRLREYFRNLNYEREFKRFYIAGLILIVALNIDFSHLRDLFFPSITGRHVPRDILDRFGLWVFLPFWEHQLRGALLFSGLVSLCLGIGLIRNPVNRVNLFLFSSSSLVFFVIGTPYFFSLTSFILPLSSVYRVHLLLFAPLIFAVYFVQIWQDSSGKRAKC